MPLRALDAHIFGLANRPDLSGTRRALTELAYFAIKEARACLFAGLFFIAVFAVPRAGVLGVPRYDLLLIIALTIQAWMIWSGLETLGWVKAITLFHIPPYWMATIIGMAIYADFFLHHFIGDYHWYLAALALGLYARTTVTFRPFDRDRSRPLFVAFILIGFFVWLAENISSFFGVWRYPNQLGARTSVHVSKWSSWSLLVIMTFTIVVNLKHIKERVHMPEWP